MNSYEFLKRLTSNTRAWRLFLALLFLLPVLLVLPHVRSLVVRNAVVTTYLGDIRAPIDGRIEDIYLTAGSVAEAGVPALEIHNDRISRNQLARLEALYPAAQLELEQLRASLLSLRELAVARHTGLGGFIEAVAADLNRQLQQAEDEALARAAELVAAEASLQRAKSLQARNLLSQAELELAQAEYETALAANSANQLQRQRLRQQQVEIRKDVFQIDIPDGVLLTRQLVQQLDLEVLRLERELREGEANLQALQAELEAAQSAFQAASSAHIELTPGATVWNVYATQGAWTTAGSVLMSVVNCDNLMVDIAVDDATLELIEPGQKVEVRLFGSFDRIGGEVVLVRGSAGLGDTPVLAAAVPERGYRKGRVLARLDASGLTGSAGQSCGIGRTAYADFEEINLFELLLYPLFR